MCGYLQCGSPPGSSRLLKAYSEDVISIVESFGLCEANVFIQLGIISLRMRSWLQSNKLYSV